jgi:hypothetical protein
MVWRGLNEGGLIGVVSGEQGSYNGCSRCARRGAAGRVGGGCGGQRAVIDF